MKTIFTKAVLGTALAATAALGMAAVVTPVQAHEWGEHRGGSSGGIAIAAGILGLAAGVAIASDHDRYDGGGGYYYDQPRVIYQPTVTCYDAYPGYDGYCYPATYYNNLGWDSRDGYWWYGGARYARPFVIGGYRGGYGDGYSGYYGGYRGYFGGGGEYRRGYDHGGHGGYGHDGRGGYGHDGRGGYGHGGRDGYEPGGHEGRGEHRGWGHR